MVGAVTSKEDHKWSDKKMEGEEGFNTVECLRRRLLAERQASKVANEEAESIGNKLVELQKKLREEIKLREKAERRLNLFMKKLNILSTSEQSYSSEECEYSFTTRDAEENEAKPHTTNSPISQSSIHEVSKPIQTHNGPSVSKDYDYPQDLCQNPGSNSEDFKNDESRLSISSSKSSTEDSIAQSTDNYSPNTSPSDSSREDPSHNQKPSSNNVKNDESGIISGDDGSV